MGIVRKDMNKLDGSSLKPEYSHLYQHAEGTAASAKRLDDIIALLRKHCPWDKVQTHQSLRKCLLEEAYETADAIDREDFENLREELGDVALQVIMHSVIATEEGHFDLSDVLNEECDKMIRRHPHIFSAFEAKTVDKVLEKWENIKSKEHGTITHTNRLRDVPLALPALTRSAKVQKRAADVGFDWDDIEAPIGKVREELDEFLDANQKGDHSAMTDELGDLLFSVVNVSRFAGIDPEEALSKATDKFIKRFEMLENSASRRGLDLKDMTLAEMDKLWDEIKHVSYLVFKED